MNGSADDSDGFQSAPLTDVRGDLGEKKDEIARFQTFQSAPLTDVRGDWLSARATKHPMMRFNPLPSRM